MISALRPQQWQHLEEVESLALSWENHRCFLWEPTLFLFFAQYILNYKVDLSGLGLKAVICTSEPLFKEQRSTISKAFLCPVINEYGISESGICAFECPYGGFHIMSENIYLEIVRNGKNIKDGEIGEIVITQLNNFSAPLIRYHTGDLG